VWGGVIDTAAKWRGKTSQQCQEGGRRIWWVRAVGFEAMAMVEKRSAYGVQGSEETRNEKVIAPSIAHVCSPDLPSAPPSCSQSQPPTIPIRSHSMCGSMHQIWAARGGGGRWMARGQTMASVSGHGVCGLSIPAGAFE